MKKEFWLEKWHKDEIGFHQQQFNPRLTQHWQQMTHQQKGDVFVPLCGKSQDMLYLAQIGHKVYGCELSQKATQQFFEENSLSYEVSGDLFSAQDISIFCTDLFELTLQKLDKIEYVYDRAALIALPEDIRIKYAQWFRTLPHLKRIMLITIEFDNPELGPPFSVNQEWIEKYYAQDFRVECIESLDIPLEDNPVHSGQIKWMKSHTFFLHKKSAP